MRECDLVEKKNNKMKEGNSGWDSNLQNLDCPETTAHVCKDQL